MSPVHLSVVLTLHQPHEVENCSGDVQRIRCNIVQVFCTTEGKVPNNEQCQFAGCIRCETDTYVMTPMDSSSGIRKV